MINDKVRMQKALSLVRSQTSDELKEVLQLIKETDSRSRVLFQKIHNLQVEVETLSTAIKGLGSVLVELFEQPESINHAEAIVRDWLIKLHKK